MKARMRRLSLDAGGSWTRSVVIAMLACSGACNGISGVSDLTIAATSSEDNAPPTPDGTVTDSGTPPGDEDRPSPGAIVSVIAPDGLDFGDNACGNSPPPRSIEIRNLGTTAIAFDAALADGMFFSVLPATGSIAAGKLGILTVSIPVAPNTVGARSDKVVVTTNASGDTPHAFDLTMAVPGAIFEVSPGSITYGQLNSLPVSKQVSIRNDGNITGTLAYEFTTNQLDSFGVSPAGPLVLAPGDIATLTVTAHPPKSGTGLRTGTLAFSSATILCGSIPPPLDLSCSRNN